MATPFNRRQFISAAACYIATSPALVLAQVPKKAGTIVRYGKAVTYRSRHSCTIQRNGSSLELLEVWLPVPSSWSEQQISKVSISPQIEPVPAKNGETRVARWIADEKALNASAPGICIVETEWKRLEIATDLKRLHAQRYLPYDEESKDYQSYISSETAVPSEDPRIVEAMDKLKGKERPWAQIAFDVYSWVLERTTYSAISWKGGKWCFEHKTGGCGDYSALFVAGCRAAGIPARMNAGYWAAEKDGVHVWAEFLLPTGEWVPVDPSIGDRSEEAKRKNFGFLDNNRITMAKTADVQLEPIRDSHESVDFLQVGAWWWKGRGSPSVKFEFVGSKIKS